MRAASAFWIPATRPAVIVLLLLVLGSISVLLLGVADPDFPTRAVDVGLLAILLYAGATGHLAGATLRDLQHCRFTWVLPGVRVRTLIGFLTTAILGAALLALFVKGSRPELNFVALVVTGVAAFCLGGVLYDPLSHLRSIVHCGLGFLLVAGSDRLGALCAARPVWVVAVGVALAGACLHRAFGVDTFRRSPFRPLAPIPGSFSWGLSIRFQREKMAQRRPARRRRRLEPQGIDRANWLRRAFEESVNGSLLRTTLLEARGWLPLAAILVVYAVAGEGNVGWRLARTLYLFVLVPPWAETIDDDLPYAAVPLFIAAMGGVLTFTRSVPLGARVLYPISRSERGRTVFRASLLETFGFLAVSGGLFLAIALLAGVYVGYPVRLDFFPQLLRAVVAVGAVIPALQWFRLRTLQTGPRRSPQAAVGFAFLLGIAVALVGAWCGLWWKLQAPPLVEVAILVALFGGAQLLYRRKLDRYFRTADLG